jgi:hypothetical protein
VKLKPLALNFDMNSSKGLQLVMGDLVFDEKSFKLQISKKDLFVYYPGDLFKHGVIEMVSKAGKVKWSQNFNRNDLLDFSDLKEKKIEELSDTDKSMWAGARFRVSEVVSGNHLNVWKPGEFFHFCITEESELGRLRLCTPLYEIKIIKKEVQFFLAPVSKENARVIINQVSVPTFGNYPVKAGESVQFYAETSSGLIVDFFVRAPQIKIVDMSKNPDGSVQIVVEGVRPLKKAEEIKQEKLSSFFRNINWVDTLGDLRLFYKIVTTTPDAGFTLRSENGGGIFFQAFEISKLPQEKHRIYIDKFTPQMTYVDDAKVYGKVPVLTKLSSSENSVQFLDGTEDEFLWRFKAEKSDAMNRASVYAEKEGFSYKSYFEMYRGLPMDLSFRYGQVLGNVNAVANIDLAFTYWFEDFLGLKDAQFSRLRWGVSLKSFESLNNLQTKIPKSSNPESTVSVFGKLKLQTLDFKYRFQQGVWNRDETTGLILSGLNFSFYDASTNMLGVGIFWARSMPKVLDDLFNQVSIFRYPKWVDAEALWYVYGTNPRAKLNVEFNPPQNFGNFALNFHGKVLWTKRFFGEAGFGIRSITYNRIYDRRIDGISPPEIIEGEQFAAWQFNFYALYALVGVGMSF